MGTLIRICSMSLCGKKIYLKYAEQYLDSDQIDELDLSGITGYVPPPAARLSLLGQLPSPTQDPKI